MNEQGDLVISLAGRIDTSNANQLKEEIDQLVEETEHQGLILDFKDLDYISSAGLREAARDYLKKFPRRATFLHGDINPGNVMIQDGELLFIDMGTARLWLSLHRSSRQLPCFCSLGK